MKNELIYIDELDLTITKKENKFLVQVSYSCDWQELPEYLWETLFNFSEEKRKLREKEAEKIQKKQSESLEEILPIFEQFLKEAQKMEVYEKI